MARPKTDRVSVSYRLQSEAKYLLKVLAGFNVLSETAMLERLISDEVERLRKDKKASERFNHVKRIIEKQE